MAEKIDLTKIKFYPDNYRDDFINIYLNCKCSSVANDFRSDYCLDSISIVDLFSLKEKKVSQIIATRSNCSTCEFNQTENKFDKKLEKFNLIVEEKDISTMAIQWIDEHSWQAMVNSEIINQKNIKSKKENTTEDEKFLSRRNFFRKLVNKVN